jgi:hypothetical protein
VSRGLGAWLEGNRAALQRLELRPAAARPAGVVDFTEQQNALRRKYGERLWLDPAAKRAQAALWGATIGRHVNDAGVFCRRVQSVRLVCVGRCCGTIRLVHAPVGLYVWAADVQTAVAGQSWAPSVSEHLGYRSRQAALRAGAEWMRRWFAAEAVTYSCAGELTRRQCRQAAARLERWLQR